MQVYGVTKEGIYCMSTQLKNGQWKSLAPRLRERKVKERGRKEKKVKSQKKGGATLFISNRANKKSAYEKCRNESPLDCFQMKGLDKKGMKWNPNGVKIRMGIKEKQKVITARECMAENWIMRTFSPPQSATTLKAYIAVRKRHCF
jgi:hypothetical protein